MVSVLRLYCTFIRVTCEDLKTVLLIEQYVYIQLRSHETVAGPVYEAKWLLFKGLNSGLKL